MTKIKINWIIFGGSSHCEEGLCDFASGEIKTFVAFERYFLPHMKEQAKEVRKMKTSRIPINIWRQRARRAYKRITGCSVSYAIG